MVEADDRAPAPDFPARQTLDAQAAKVYHQEAMGDMFDLLDDDVESIAADLFEPQERLLALFAGHPSHPRHFLACSERSLVLFKRDRESALSIRIVPIGEVEAIDLRPMSATRTGALVLRTLATSAGPAFTFPLETHFAYYRVVALTRLLRRLQAGEPIDVALARLKLEAYPACELFVGDVHTPQPPLPQPGQGPAPTGPTGQPGARADVDEDEPFAGFESHEGARVPPEVEHAAAAAQLEASERETAAAVNEAAPAQEGAAENDAAQAGDVATLTAESAADAASKDGATPEANADAAGAPDANVASSAVPAAASSAVPGAASNVASDATPDADDGASARPSQPTLNADQPTETHLAATPPHENDAAAKATEPVDSVASMFASATPFRTSLSAVSDVNLPALSEKQLRGRMKMKEPADDVHTDESTSAQAGGEGSNSGSDVGDGGNEGNEGDKGDGGQAGGVEREPSAHDGTNSGGNSEERPNGHGHADNPTSDPAAKPAPDARVSAEASAAEPPPQASDGKANEEASADGNGTTAAPAGGPRRFRIASDVTVAPGDAKPDARDPKPAPRPEPPQGKQGQARPGSGDRPPGSPSASPNAAAAKDAVRRSSAVRKSQGRGTRPMTAAADAGASATGARRSQSARRTQRNERQRTHLGNDAAAPTLDPSLLGESWFLYRGAAQHGPYTFEQLRDWFQSGKLGASEFIRARSMNQWIRVHQVFTT